MKNLLYNIKATLKEWLSYVPGFLVMLLILALFIGAFKMVKSHLEFRRVLYEHLTKAPTVNSNSIPLPDSSQVFIVQPQGEQEVIIIGDPTKVTVKPTKKYK